MLQPCTTFAIEITEPLLTAESLNPRSQNSTNSAAAPPPTYARFPSLSAALEALRAEWEFDTYALEVSLPAAFAVRSQAAWWAAQRFKTRDDDDDVVDDTHEEEEDDTCFPPPQASIRDVREAIRSSFAAQLKASLGKTTLADQEATMRLTLKCELPAEVAHEGVWLAPPPLKIGRKQKFRNRKKNNHDTIATKTVSSEGAPSTAESSLGIASPGMVSKLAAMSKKDFFISCPPSAASLSSPPSAPVVILSPHRTSQYIGGRYIKLRRGLPQSPWIMDGGERKGDSSVQEEIAVHVLPSFRADAYVFMSSGREDIDVRMLGSGRPFVIELKNARKAWPGAAAARALEAAVAAGGGGVEVRGLRDITQDAVAVLKQGEQEKRKSYAAVCWLPRAVTLADVEKINSMGKAEIEVEQWTPLRVLHRRANCVRRRAVHEMHAEILHDHPVGYFLLKLTTAAGTYVKEFVHGDRGRTQPCMKDILGGCASTECVYLDVTGVDLDFL